MDAAGPARRAEGGRVGERGERLRPRAQTSSGQQRVERADAARARGGGPVVDPREQRPASHRASTASASSRACATQVVVAGHAGQLEGVPRHSAVKPTEPTANAGLWSGAPPARPLDRADQRRPSASNHAGGRPRPASTCRPSGGCRRSPTPTGGRAPPARRRCGAAGRSRNRSPRCARSTSSSSGAHPEPGELGDGVPVHRRLGDRWRRPRRPQSAACGGGPAP